jgi:O-antigen ligase
VRTLVPLLLLVLLLPFEPMRPLAGVAGFELSHLELAALLLLAGSAAGLVSRRLRVPLAGGALALLLAYLISSSAAAVSGGSVLPWKFTLRLAAGVVAFALTSAALSVLPRFDLLFIAFAVSGALTAAVALVEWTGWPPAEVLVAPFREHSFEVGGRPRVAGTFSYPNTAGGFLVLALAPAMSFVARPFGAGWMRAAFFLASLAMFAAIVLTYSRGALLGALAAAACLWWLARRKRPEAGHALLRLQGAFVLVAIGFLAFEPSLRWRASSEGDRSWYSAEIAPAEEHLALSPGELGETTVSITNSGKLTWGSAGAKPFHLSYRWFRVAEDGAVEPLELEGERTTLDCTLAPGEDLSLRAAVRAPRQPGSYVLIWDMVQEHTTWFSDKVGLGAPVSVVVGSETLAAMPRPRELRDWIAERAWRPGRRELWGIALRLFLAHPWLGVGPDNFRWLYGPAAGHDTWDTRVFSNSLYLELLATVGILGFAAFAFLIGSTLVQLTRRLRSADPSLDTAVLAASLLGFLVHGLVDYLLAFTGIYLAFFVLLGAASAATRQEAFS